MWPMVTQSHRHPLLRIAVPLSVFATTLVLLGTYHYLAESSWLSAFLKVGGSSHNIQSLEPGLHPRTFFPETSASSSSLLQDAQVTRNGGFLMIKSDDAAPVGYGISVFHQIHCIEMLRASLFPVDGLHEHDHTGSRHEEREHLGHCLDYLAQVQWLNPFCWFRH